jgi:hypothetical protein
VFENRVLRGVFGQNRERDRKTNRKLEKIP